MLQNLFLTVTLRFQCALHAGIFLKSSVTFCFRVPYFWCPTRMTGCQFNGRWFFHARKFAKSFHRHQTPTAPKSTGFTDPTTESSLLKDMQTERVTSELLPAGHRKSTVLSACCYEYIYIHIHTSLAAIFFLYSKVSTWWSTRDIFSHWNVVLRKFWRKAYFTKLHRFHVTSLPNVICTHGELEKGHQNVW